MTIECLICRGIGRILKRRWGLTKICPSCGGKGHIEVIFPFPQHLVDTEVKEVLE